MDRAQHEYWLMATAFVYGMEFQCNWSDPTIPKGTEFADWYSVNYNPDKHVSLSDAYRSFIIEQTKLPETATSCGDDNG